MLVVRDVGGKSRIEFPMGKVLYETSGHVSYARLSPKGDRIAFLDHPFPLDDAGTVAVIDLSGKKTTLTGKWASEHGLAWAPSGEEVWFTATEAGANRSLYAVTLVGTAARRDARAGRPEAPRHREERPRPPDAREPARRDPRHARRATRASATCRSSTTRSRPTCRADGKLLLFDEEGEAGGANYTVFLRKSDRSPVVRLGEGNALALSPDGKWALSIMPAAELPLPPPADRARASTGSSRSPGLSAEQAATWFPDSKRILFAASETGHGRAALRPGASTAGSRGPITPEGISTALPGFAVSPDGKFVAAIGPDHKGAALPRGRRRAARPIPGVLAGRVPAALLAGRPRDLRLEARRHPRAHHAPRPRDRASARSGRTSSRPTPPASSGSRTSSSTPDGKGYAYCYARLLSDLFVVEGLK